jgi:tetratricopeptide (TPR) repeat protein
MTTDGTKPVIFISYAHLDEPERPRDDEVQWLTFVTGFLKSAEKRGAIVVWTDRLMPGGANWRRDIDRKLRGCDIFILLISHNSLASNYVVDKEISVIRERQAKGEDVHFYPLLLTPTPDIALDIVNDENRRPRGGKSFFDYPLNERYRHMADAVNEIVVLAKEIGARKSALAAPPSEPPIPPPEPSVSAKSPAPEPVVVPSPLPPNPRMIGREDRLEELVKAILEQGRPIVVPGGLGMGKTTLALAAAHDSRVVARFGKARRFFVNLEPAPNAEGALTRLATDLGLPASGAASEVEAKIAAACAGQPTLAILDNLETPWDKDTAATEALLGRLAAIDGLRLVITVRGEPPKLPGAGARTLRDVEQLQDADGRALFLRHAGDHFAADPALPGLLSALDGHPLSIELLAANAQGKPDLKGLAADWSHRRADLLRHGAGDDRKTSLRASVDLSLAALDPPSSPHRLIRLMALLPDGMSDADSRTILNDGEPTREERGAAARLETARLANRPDGRWRLLAPIRETLLADVPPEAEDRTRLVKVFLRRAALGDYAGTDKWNEVREELIAEAGNLDSMIGIAAKAPESLDGLSSAVTGLRELHRLTGLASCVSVPAVAKRLHEAGDLLGEADCITSLGDIALRRSDHDGARQRYEEALPLYRKVGAVPGEANCIKGLGNIALRRSDDDGARQRYEAALPLFQKVGDLQGEANCILRLGDLDESEGEIALACGRWREALALYARIPEPYSIGFAHIRLARHAPTPAEAAEHRQAARKAWESIDRPDLIEQHLGRDG